MNESSAGVEEYLSQLVALSYQGKIAWQAVSPNTYSADRTTSAGVKRMTLTRAGKVPREPIANYLFQVEEVAEKRKMQLVLDTRERSELIPVFEALYGAAKASVDAGLTRILKELVS